MKRTPIVVLATVAGLAGVLAFHTTPHPSVTALPGTAVGGPRPSGPRSSPTQRPAASGQTAGTRTVDGPQVNYNYGILSVSVTVRDHKITKVGIASLNDGGNFRSQSIDQQSIPLLEQQAMQAQSASIQGVSGASYTSAGFQQSLQYALHQLGIR